MRNLARHLLLLVAIVASSTALMVSSCGIVREDRPASDEPIDWPELLSCGPAVPEIATTVSNILLDGDATQTAVGDRAVTMLEDLAREYGPDTVACLVDLWQREWTRPGASANPARAAAATRADSFLDRVGTVVDSNQAFSP